MQKNGRLKKGFAIPTLLMIIPVILMMTVALFLHLQSNEHWTGNRYAQTAAQYVTEAGAEHAVQELKAAPDWVAGFSNQAMSAGKGAYTVVFNQTKTGFQPFQSVNNFDGAHGDSPLGPNTVPAGAALIAVEANVGTAKKLSYFLVGTGDDTIRVEQALLTSGKIKLEGETKFTAVESMAEKGSLDAVIHSNLATAASDLITWLPGVNGGNLLVEGEVTSSGSSSTAVDLNGYTPTNGVTTNAAQQAIPPAGIVTKVHSKRAATAFTGGNSVPSGDNYYDATSSPLVVNGDLVLDGDLYVEGDFQVNGSISGKGAVYVTGDSSLYGDARIDGDDKVALMSHGSVTLSGFGGDAFLDSIADPTFQAWLTDSRNAMAAIDTALVGGAWTNDALVVQFREVLGDTTSTVPSGYTHNNALSKMSNYISTNVPAGPTANFVTDKLNSIHRLFSTNTPAFGLIDDHTSRNDFLLNGIPDGIVDAAFDLNDSDLKLAAYNLVHQLSYDKLGSSYFQGLIYTNGGFYADNQVTVLGAIVVNDDGSQSPFTAPSGDTVNPGDLILKGGSNVTYVKDFFFGPNSGTAGGPRRVLLHLGNG